MNLKQLKDVLSLLKDESDFISAVNQTGKIDFAIIVDKMAESTIAKISEIMTGQKTDDVFQQINAVTGFFLIWNQSWQSNSNLQKLGDGWANLLTVLQSDIKM